MSEQSKVSDPFTLWREWFDRSERQINAAFNEFMATDEFKVQQARAMEAFLSFQRAMGERSQELLNYTNLPSHNDIVRLAEELIQRLESIDQRLGAIEARLGCGPGGDGARRELPSRPTRPRPRRTRRPPEVDTGAAE